jgi:tripartite-type tricarboxylate transporter receptor subunit TctC
LVREGRLRALGVTTASRVPSMAEVPPLAEVGLPGFDAASWHMFVVPAATPGPIVQRLYAEIDTIIKEPDVVAEISKRGFAPSAGGPPDQLARFVRSEFERWSKVGNAAGAGGIE